MVKLVLTDDYSVAKITRSGSDLCNDKICSAVNFFAYEYIYEDLSNNLSIVENSGKQCVVSSCHQIVLLSNFLSTPQAKILKIFHLNILLKLVARFSCFFRNFRANQIIVLVIIFNLLSNHI